MRLRYGQMEDGRRIRYGEVVRSFHTLSEHDSLLTPTHVHYPQKLFKTCPFYGGFITWELLIKSLAIW